MVVYYYDLVVGGGGLFVFDSRIDHVLRLCFDCYGRFFGMVVATYV